MGGTGVSGAESAGVPVPVGGAVRALLSAAEALLASARQVLADHHSAREAVRAALAPLREELVGRELETVPVSRLKDVTQGRLRVGALEQAGLMTVRQVLEAGPYALRQIPGVGRQTADQTLAAARQIAGAVEESVTVRLDLERAGDPHTAALLTALNRLVNAGPDIPRAVEAARRIEDGLAPALPAARPAAGRLRMLAAGARRRTEARAAVGRIDALMADCAGREVPLLLAQASADLLRPADTAEQTWLGFESRSADYYSLLAETADLGPDVRAAEGYLPAGVGDRVRAQRLDDTHRRVSLRGYQAFGARFALAQRRVILGDEMGLGKTIQAIAALAHLKSEGATHFLVVCPASVLVNWLREIESRSTLAAYRLHGPDRALAAAEWTGRGDVAVTTFDALAALDPAGLPPVGMLVVDEAHYVKNAASRRSLNVARWAGHAGHVLYLTGTPMENNVAEFRALVGQLQPELVDGIRNIDAAAGSQTFRKAVGPAYLRRNQQDVLTELPDLVRVDEWDEFSPEDLAAYRAAVADANFQAMRRAAYADPARSAKLRRLRELVEEAAESQLKVVVFSNFRDVLGAVRDALGPAVFGPLTGRLAAAERQALVDDFTAAPGHAVLLSQIQAGGVGLNLQAASVVILCEPQVKPTLEAQAIARAHRMGQVRRVRVHRLLTTDSVDQRLLRLLDRKTRLFDAFARRSDTAESTPDAVDISELSLARLVVEEEQRQLARSEQESGRPEGFC